MRCSSWDASSWVWMEVRLQHGRGGGCDMPRGVGNGRDVWRCHMTVWSWQGPRMQGACLTWGSHTRCRVLWRSGTTAGNPGKDGERPKWVQSPGWPPACHAFHFVVFIIKLLSQGYLWFPGSSHESCVSWGSSDIYSFIYSQAFREHLMCLVLPYMWEMQGEHDPRPCPWSSRPSG